MCVRARPTAPSARFAPPKGPAPPAHPDAYRRHNSVRPRERPARPCEGSASCPSGKPNPADSSPFS